MNKVNKVKMNKNKTHRTLTPLQQEVISKGIEQKLSREDILEKLKIQRDTAKMAVKDSNCFARDTFKNSTMTVSAYGAKFLTVRDNVISELHKSDFFVTAKKEHISRFALDSFVCINETMESATRYKEYANRMLKAHLKDNDIIVYRTPLTRFPVILRINKIERRSIAYKIPGINKQGVVCLLEETNEIDKRKTISSTIPSIIHSLDGAILLRTRERFNKDMTGIHDSFGALANNIDYLHECINETLIELFKCNALQDIASQLDYDEEVPNFGLGEEFIEVIRQSEYCFN